MNEEQLRQLIRQELYNFLGSEKIIFENDLKLLDGKNIQLGTKNGTQFGTSSSQKISFLGATSVSQQSKINDPSGGATIDAEARTAINSLIDVLESFGFSATS